MNMLPRVQWIKTKLSEKKFCGVVQN